MWNYFMALHTYIAIGERARALNDGNFGELFALLQNQCAITLLLALAKTLDKDKQSRGVPEAIRLLSNHAKPLSAALVNAGALQEAVGKREPDREKLIVAFAHEAERRVQDGAF
jgi:hypothetical protein